MSEISFLRNVDRPVEKATADHVDAFTEQSIAYMALRLAMATAITAVMLFVGLIMTGLVWGASVTLAEYFWTSRSRRSLARRGQMLRIDYFMIVGLNLVLTTTYMTLAVFLVMQGSPLMGLAAGAWVAGGFFAAVLVLVPDRILMATTYGPAILGMITVANMVDWSWQGEETMPYNTLSLAISLFFSVFVFRAFQKAVDFQLRAYNDRQALEQRRIAAERASINKTAFLARMSHEIRTPLNGVMGCASLLSQTGLDQRQRQLAGQIVRSGDTLLGVLNEILDISRIEIGGFGGERKEFDVAQLFGDLVDLTIPEAEHRKVIIFCHIDYRLPARVVGDVPRIRQVMANLFANAVKYNETGALHVCIWHGGNDHEGMKLIIDVFERGDGMAPLARFMAHHPFSEHYKPGEDLQDSSGLGLMICRDLADHMDGSMKLDEMEDGGYSIHVELPLGVDRNTPSLGKRWHDRLAGKSVLLLDKPHDRTHTFIASMEEMGLIAHTVASAQEGVVLAEAMHAAGEPLNFVIGCNGSGQNLAHDWARQLRDVSACSETLFVANDVVGSDEAGFYDLVIAHSIQPKQLPAALVQVMDQGPRNRQHVPNAPQLHGRKILIVEEEASNRMLLKALVEATGAEASIAPTAEEVPKLLASVRPDVLMLSLTRDRAVGLDSILHSVSSEDQPSVIAILAHQADPMRGRYIKAGVTKFLPKPLAVHQVYAVLREEARRLPERPEMPAQRSKEAG
ncbi:MAG: histidine kinase dimerization/phospho-acceptor domain-containing protein [Pseudomonadota bacterium]